MPHIVSFPGVVFTGTLLRLSIIKKSDTPKAWMNRFYPLVVILACLPLINFYNFLMLASRVIRIIYHYCDDFVSSSCMVTSTPAWERLLNGLMIVAGVVLVLHLTLPSQEDEVQTGQEQATGPATGVGRGGAVAPPEPKRLPPPAYTQVDELRSDGVQEVIREP